MCLYDFLSNVSLYIIRARRQIWKLQSVDNLFVVMHRVHHAKFVEDEERDLNYLYGLVANLPWKKSKFYRNTDFSKRTIVITWVEPSWKLE